MFPCAVCIPMQRVLSPLKPPKGGAVFFAPLLRSVVPLRYARLPTPFPRRLHAFYSSPTLLIINSACRSDHQRRQGRPVCPKWLPKTAKGATASSFVVSFAPYAAAPPWRADHASVRRYAAFLDIIPLVVLQVLRIIIR